MARAEAVRQCALAASLLALLLLLHHHAVLTQDLYVDNRAGAGAGATQP